MCRTTGMSVFEEQKVVTCLMLDTSKGQRKNNRKGFFSFCLSHLSAKYKKGRITVTTTHKADVQKIAFFFSLNSQVGISGRYLKQDLH